MNIEEFNQLAYKSVRRIGENLVDYSNPLLLFSPGSENIYSELQVDGNTYHEHVTSQEINFLNKIARPLMSQFPYGINFIDLGPGTKYEKQEILMKALCEFAPLFEYYAIDANREMAEQAKNYFSEKFQETMCVMYEGMFENIDEIIVASEDPKVSNFFCMTGLTFQNYDFEDIIKIIDSCLHHSGVFFATFQPKEYSLEDIACSYHNPLMNMLVEKKMSLLGFQPSDYELSITNEVKAYAKILSIDTCKHPDIAEGDTILIGVSIRYPLNEIKETMEEKYHCQFRDNGKFAGVLLKKK